MRNSKSNVRTVKRKLTKCQDVCRTFNDIQYAYADLLEKDDLVKEFRCNVPLEDFEIEGAYTTDFLVVRTNGDIYIRECVLLDKIIKPLNIKLLDASHRYWNSKGIVDWGIVTNEDT